MLTAAPSAASGRLVVSSKKFRNEERRGDRVGTNLTPPAGHGVHVCAAKSHLAATLLLLRRVGVVMRNQLLPRLSADPGPDMDRST